MKTENIFILQTKYGGHIGWYEGNLLPTRWFTKKCLRFCNFIRNTEIDKKNN